MKEHLETIVDLLEEKVEGICCGIYQGTPENRGHPIDLDDPTLADAEFIALARNAFDGDSEALAWWEANRRK